MDLDLTRFFQVSNPARGINMTNPSERQYYIDFSTVRGGKLTSELERTITRLSPDQPTCQLFTGHIGCGKTTELLRLKTDLEQQNFHVVYFESSQDLDMADVDITDILLAIARQVSESLEKLKIPIFAQGFQSLLQGITDVFQSQIGEIKGEANIPGLGGISLGSDGEFSLSVGIGKITTKAKDAPKLREQLRQYLEPRTNNILEAINKELIKPAIEQLKKRGKQGLVVIIDNLDRVDSTMKQTGRRQPEYLFVDRGEQLRRLNCHLVYTIPLVLVFSNELEQIINRFGVEPKVLHMIPVKRKDGTPCQEGLMLLQQMVLARAFPNIDPDTRLTLITKIFDTPETLDRLCQISGGHLRILLGLLYSCMQQQDPPIFRTTLETVINQRRHQLGRAIEAEEWELLRHVDRIKNVTGEYKYQTLIRSLWVFEYRYQDDYWSDINPILREAKEFQKE